MPRAHRFDADANWEPNSDAAQKWRRCQHDQNRGKCVASPRARPASDHPRGSGSTPRREERHREPGEGDGEVKGKRMRSPSSLSWRNHPKGSKGCASFMGSSKGIEKQTMSWIVTGASDEQVDQVNRVRRAERERSWTEEGQVSKGW